MALGRIEKEVIIDEVANIAKTAHSVVGADYRGLTVSQMTELRSKARSTGVYLRVVRNTLARRAVKNTDFECIDEALTGPLILGFSQEDPGSAARLFRDFSKENETLEVKMLSVSGQLLPASDLGVLANLPTLDQARAILLGTMKAPVEKFVRTLAAPHTKLVRTLAAVKDHKEQAA